VAVRVPQKTTPPKTNVPESESEWNRWSSAGRVAADAKRQENRRVQHVTLLF